MYSLKAEKRSLDVTAKSLRREGYVIGNVYGKSLEHTIPIQMNVLDVNRFFREGNGKGTQLSLDIDGEDTAVILQEMDYNALKREYTSLDFMVTA